MEPLTPDQWRELFAAVRSDAFHLELRDSYGVVGETEPFARWLAGQPDTWEQTAAWFAPWTERVRALVDAGATVRRLRVVTEPLSDYIRWEHHDTPHNLAAGEQVKWLPRHQLPDDMTFPCGGRDYWLLDDRLAVFGRVDEQGRSVGRDLVTDPVVVAHAATVRDRLWTLGVPHDQYQPVI